MRQILITVGTAGSGKSSWIKEHYDLTDNSVFRINADAIRYMLYGDENTQGSGNRVFKLVYLMFEEALKMEHVDTIIIDNTNLTYNIRNNFYRIIKSTFADYSKHVSIKLVTFYDHEKALIQNANRERTVPEDVMYRMIRSFEPINEIETRMGVKEINIS